MKSKKLHLTENELALIYGLVAQFKKQHEIVNACGRSAHAVSDAINDAGGAAEIGGAILSGRKTAQDIAKEVIIARKKASSTVRTNTHNIRVKEHQQNQLDRIEQMILEIKEKLAGL